MARWPWRSAEPPIRAASGPPRPSVSSTAKGSSRVTLFRRGTSTTMNSSVPLLLTIPNPTPPSCSRAAIERSAGEGSSHPLGWLWSTISPRSATPGRARTSSAVPRATARTWVMIPASSTVPTKQTSRPPAAAISRARRVVTAGARREVGIGENSTQGGAGQRDHQGDFRCERGRRKLSDEDAKLRQAGTRRRNRGVACRDDAWGPWEGASRGRDDGAGLPGNHPAQHHGPRPGPEHEHPLDGADSRLPNLVLDPREPSAHLRPEIGPQLRQPLTH